MSKKRRVVIGVAAMELLLAGIWVYLATTGMIHPSRTSPDFQATVGSTMGAAMGALLGFGVLMFFVAAKNDRSGRGPRT